MADNSKIFINYLSKLVHKNLRLPHESPAITQEIIRMYNNINPEYFQGKRASDVAPKLAELLSNKISTNVNIKEMQKQLMNDENPMDVAHEMEKTVTYKTFKKQSKTSVQISDFMGINDIPTLQLMFNPESLYVHYYVCMNTNNRLVEEDEGGGGVITKFKWNYAPTKDVRSGYAVSSGDIRNVVGIRMYQPRIHYLAGMDNTANRVSILIEELQTQSFVAENGHRFHFLLRPDIENRGLTGDYVELSTEDYEDAIFKFRKPITEFDTLTISFGDPFTVLSFPSSFNAFFLAIEFTCLKYDIHV